MAVTVPQGRTQNYKSVLDHLGLGIEKFLRSSRGRFWVLVNPLKLHEDIVDRYMHVLGEGSELSDLHWGLPRY